jgi:hypothetical protein
MILTKARTVICKIIVNPATDFNGFLYQFTTEKSLKTVAWFPFILQSPVRTYIMVLYMYQYIHVYTSIHEWAYIHAYIQIYIHLCIHTNSKRPSSAYILCMCIHILRIHTHTCIRICMRTHTHTYMHSHSKFPANNICVSFQDLIHTHTHINPNCPANICMSSRSGAYIHIYIHTYIHTHTHTYTF